MYIPILRLPYSAEEISFISKGIAQVLRSGYLTMGPKVREFEEQFAAFVRANFAVAVNSGTSALEIILRAVGVRGKTVVVPTVTFMATPLSVIHAGGRVVFTDIRGEDCSIDPEDLKRKIREDTSAIIVVHIGGVVSAKFDEIAKICVEHRICLIEDAAHAHGSMWHGTQVGILGSAAAFSFYPTKILTTAEGGMITTNDESIYQEALTLREHGKPDPRYNVHTEVGYNWRFSEIHAVLGLQQMNKAQALIEERRRLAALYDKYLEGIEGLIPLRIPTGNLCAYYKYMAFLDDGINREWLKQTMKEKYNVILPGEVYAEPCHSQPVFAKYPEYVLNDPSHQFPGADYVCSRQICLPLYPGLSEEEVVYIVECLQAVLKRYSSTQGDAHFSDRR